MANEREREKEKKSVLDKLHHKVSQKVKMDDLSFRINCQKGYLGRSIKSKKLEIFSIYNREREKKTK